MGKWDKYKKNKGNKKVEDNINKTNINWIMLFYGNTSKNVNISSFL